MSRLPIVPFALLFVLPACSTPAARQVDDSRAQAARRVTSVRVTEQPFERTVTVTGTLAAEEQVALAFNVSGQVDQVAVDLGALVREGQVVARLVPTDFDLRVQQAEAALAQARARLGLPPDGAADQVDPEVTALVRQRAAMLREAQLNRDRTRTFVDRGISPRASLDTAEAALQVAEGQHQDAIEEIRNRQAVLAQRRSELQIARQQRQDSVLRAPISGAVRQRQVTLGEYRTAGTPVMTIVRTNPLRLQVSVPERVTTGLRVGLPVRVRVDGETTAHSGTLARIGAAIDETNRSLPIEAVVDNPQGELRPGQFATADIVVSTEDKALVVPADAIVTFAGVQKVLVVKDGVAREQRIRTGRRSGDRVEVLEGLDAAAVVVRAPGDLVDGTAVTAQVAE